MFSFILNSDSEQQGKHSARERTAYRSFDSVLQLAIDLTP